MPWTVVGPGMKHEIHGVARTFAKTINKVCPNDNSQKCITLQNMRFLQTVRNSRRFCLALMQHARMPRVRNAWKCMATHCFDPSLPRTVANRLEPLYQRPRTNFAIFLQKNCKNVKLRVIFVGHSICSVSRIDRFAQQGMPLAAAFA